MPSHGSVKRLGIENGYCPFRLDGLIEVILFDQDSNSDDESYCEHVLKRTMDTTLASRTPILYQNADRITLLDIPCSISVAQGTPSHPSRTNICSAPAIQRPYPSTEPKSAKAKANIFRMNSTIDADSGFSPNLLQAALADVSRDYEGEWCLERVGHCAMQTNQGKYCKYRADDVHVSSFLSDKVGEYSEISLLEREDTMGFSLFHNDRVIILVEKTGPSGAIIPTRVSRLTGTLFCNSYPHMLSVQYERLLQQTGETYRIPPRASFFVSKINQTNALAWSMAVLELYSEASATAGPAQFDFLLLDPPWENRSVRRGRFYDTMRDEDPLDVLKGVLEQHIAPQGLVACWITNKVGVRVAALEVFENWGVQIIEEWAWLKITAHGEPVTKIDGLWRKPYEILLVGKKSDDTTGHRDFNILERVIIAVPDIHSRKPNLQKLIDPMMPADYRAVEIFGRNLTAGWSTWGDECIKYAQDDHWSEV